MAEWSIRWSEWRAQNRRLVIAAMAVIVLFIGLWLLFALDAKSWQVWVELLNGATWPSPIDQTYADHPWMFGFVLALRTVLNFAPVLVILLLVWEITNTIRFGKAGIMKMLDLLRVRDVEATNQVLADLNISREQKEKVAEAIATAGKAWEKDYLPVLIGEEAAKGFMHQHYGEKPKGQAR